MTEQRPDALNDIDAMTDEQRSAVEAEEIARRTHEADVGTIEDGLGHMGGAGAQGGIQPDVAKISKPAVTP
jgi:hypothetical protein